MITFKTLNKFNKEVNILHFQGKNISLMPKTVNAVYKKAKLYNLNNNIAIVTIFTNKKKAILAHQLEKNHIQYFNALPNDYDYSQEWYMPNKIKYFINILEKIDSKVILILDAYDVLISSFDNIYEKFINQKYRILFNATYNNFPDEEIDYIENREQYDDWHKYFNAGCCIGYKEDLIRFYSECLEFINIENKLNSEQKIVRTCFAKYSNNKNQNFVWIDFKRNIFNTIGMEAINYNAYNNILIITDNKNN